MKLVECLEDGWNQLRSKKTPSVRMEGVVVEMGRRTAERSTTTSCHCDCHPSCCWRSRDTRWYRVRRGCHRGALFTHSLLGALEVEVYRLATYILFLLYFIWEQPRTCGIPPLGMSKKFLSISAHSLSCSIETRYSGEFPQSLSA